MCYQPYLKIKHELVTKNIINNEEVNIDPPSLIGRILLCYSLHTNIRSIFTVSTQYNSNSTFLPFINGLKACFMLYIVLLHTLLYQYSLAENAYMPYKLGAMFVNQMLSNSSYSVDTYFCIGGFLVSYIFYKSQKGKKPYKFIQGLKKYLSMVLYRYIRLTPVYAVILLITYTLWQMTAQEYPMFNRIPTDQVEKACSKYWWRNLLYISTFYSRDDMCMSWSWYLSDDMQFFVVQSLLLLVSTAYNKLTLYILGILPIVSIVCGAVTSYVHKFVPTLDELVLQLEVIYDPFLIRMGPYFVGVLAGYYINKWDNKIPLQKSTIRKISYASVLMIVYIIHGVYGRNKLPLAYIALYMGLSRTLWGLCISWLIITCISGDAGSVNNFLSLRFWVPISRISYCLFLVNPIIISLFAKTGGVGMHITYAASIHSSVGIFTVSFFAAVVVSLLFEIPYALLLKLILEKQVTKKEI